MYKGIKEFYRSYITENNLTYSKNEERNYIFNYFKSMNIVGKLIEDEFGYLGLIVGMNEDFIHYGYGRLLPISKIDDYIFDEISKTFIYNKKDKLL